MKRFNQRRLLLELIKDYIFISSKYKNFNL